MPFALQLFVDPVSDTAVRSLWEELASKGLSSLRDSGNRPHFSLALSIASLGIFPGEQAVVFLAPIVIPDLLDLHREVHQLLQGAGAFPTPYYLPGHWTPHCALATQVPPHLVSHVVAIGLGMSFPSISASRRLG